MINVEKMLSDLYNNGMNRKDIDKKIEDLGYFNTFKAGIPGLNELTAELTYLMRAGFTANIENQNEQGKEDDVVDAQYNTVMDIMGLSNDGDIKLSKEGRLVMYHFVTGTMHACESLERENNFNALDEHRKLLEKELFNKSNEKFNYVASKEMYKKEARNMLSQLNVM